MPENETHIVYLIGGSKEGGDLFAWEVYPKEPTFDKAIRGKSAELIVAAADANLLSINYFGQVETMECEVFDKKGNHIGKTPRRSPLYKDVAEDVALLLKKEKVKITIR